MPSTFYETADSSEDDFDDDDEISDDNDTMGEDHSSKASTLDGLIFGAGNVHFNLLSIPSILTN